MEPVELNPDDLAMPSTNTGNPLKEFILEGVLRRLNLTSYNRLASLQKHLAALLAEREESAKKVWSLHREIDKLELEKVRLETYIFWLEHYFKHPLTATNSAVGQTPDEMVKIIGQQLAEPNWLAPVAALLLELYRDSGDHVLDFLTSIYRQALDEHTAYWDVRKSVHILGQVLQARTYLEIGTRMGWSLAQAFRANPDVHAYSFDMWVPDYSGSQGSTEFVRGKMQQAVSPGKTPHVEFISGNSHDTLPDFFAGKLDVKPPPEFDVIVVDGDHSALGAWWDLTDVIPHIRVGGALVFDDIELTEELGHEYTTSIHPRPDAPPNMRNLVDVWRILQEHYPNFHYFTCETYSARAGVAIRMS
ncbi:MAG: class I SAM-dependent methyltransferase [Anaerolineae bacterium]|nr:class I SAM-dependent methyltransferase [Anaerolineae bacterium]